MRTNVRRTALTCALTVATVTLATPASAHGRWFAEGTHGGDWAFFLSPLPLALTAVALLVAAGLRAVAGRLPRPELEILPPLRQARRLGALVPYLPRLLALHVGIALVTLSVMGAFLFPSMPLEEVPGGGAAGFAQAAVGLWLLTGLGLRGAAGGLVALTVLLGVSCGPVTFMENGDKLAVATFLALSPGAPRARPDRLGDLARRRWALLGVRVLLGGTLVTLAISEKLTHPEMMRHLMARHPEIDPVATFGLPLEVDTIIVVAGVVELALGVFILLGVLPQVTVLAALVPFNATLLVFGLDELVGHLPIYGLFLVLLVHACRAETHRDLQWFPSSTAMGHRSRRTRAVGAGNGEQVPSSEAPSTPWTTPGGTRLG
ncbi:hypothetical protein [Cellulomonas bogoriensis]|nr:hypothetical protein [Cellulomonas bogoriensis]